MIQMAVTHGRASEPGAIIVPNPCPNPYCLVDIVTEVDTDTSGAALVKAVIADWRDSLINLTGNNRLINFKMRETSCVTIEEPTSHEVLQSLLAGDTYQFRSLNEEAEAEEAEADLPEVLAGRLRDEDLDLDSETLYTNTTPKRLAGALRNLTRKSTQEYLDKGVWILYLAYGVLHWVDVDDTEYESPIVLVPVELKSEGPNQPPRLSLAEEEPTVNPALTMKLGEFSIEVPQLGDELSSDEVQAVLSDLRREVAGRAGWIVNDTLALSYFSFHKEAMYRDLRDNEDQIAANELIEALASGGAGDVGENFWFEPFDEQKIDQLAPPEIVPIISDADSSQRACIAAAANGKSFVIDGPPGTGKSQTITNLIAVSLRAGKSVLFVSEKAAALEVVRNRLSKAGLGAYLLELHSHKARRKDVAQSLGEGLFNAPVAPQGMDPIDRARAEERRNALNAYAEALNAKRQPLGLSLHQVIGRVSMLKDVPTASSPDICADRLTTEELNDIAHQSAGIERNWRVAAQGSSYLWRDVVTNKSTDAILYQARSRIESLAQVVRSNADLGRAFGLTKPSQARLLHELTLLAERRPTYVPDSWLCTPNPVDVQEAIRNLENLLGSITSAETALEKTSGVAPEVVPTKEECPTRQLPDTNDPEPPLPAVRDLYPEAASARAEDFMKLASTLDLLASDVEELAASLGLRTTDQFTDIPSTLAVVDIARGPSRPLKEWLDQAATLEVEVAIRELKSATADAHAAATSAQQYFTEKALEIDSDLLASRFANVHTGLKKLGGAYRADRTIVAEASIPGIRAKDNIPHLPLATAWKTERERLARLETEFAPILGSYYKSFDTDWESVEAALVNARVVTDTQIDNLSLLSAQVCGAERISSAQESQVERIRSGLDQWARALASNDPMRPHERLGLGTIRGASRWLHDVAIPTQAAADAGIALSAKIQRKHTLGNCLHILSLRDNLADLTNEINNEADGHASILGDLYRGRDTSISDLEAAFAWTMECRQFDDPKNELTDATDALTSDQLSALKGTHVNESLPSVLGEWEVARDALLACFAIERAEDLADELDDYEEAQAIIVDFMADSTGKDEWFDYHAARTSLAKHNLLDVVDFCIDEGVPASVVPDVILKATLSGWIDDVLKSDPALTTTRSDDRDGLVDDYRSLDRRLRDTAISEIIEAVNERRPKSMAGQAKIIQREAEKSRKHMPVRKLLGDTRDVATSIKPCFMMSPLAVSQYLPPDMTFDIVIFDEASQVEPADAINCIYRGKSLIIAGDQKQLPPSTFFAAATQSDSDEWVEGESEALDYRSVLDLAKSSAALNSITLRWHYRSRHEGLIAFSNAKFYDGRLITFPSAEQDGDDVGVRFFYVRGTYRRGTSRDNPIEAAAVADRVIHHFDTRPDMTLGVVAFSDAQAGAIESAVEQRRLERPDLEHLFSVDRLDGFFIKNLESVQGDERDVMIFSVGYGPDENGKVWNNFGPVNKAGCWRRLNVAITRARYRTEVVSSVHASDITDGGNESLRHFKSYLDYAERGPAALAFEDSTSLGDPESPFEESVIDVVRSWGYQVSPQVGTLGYRIDIGVLHPERPRVMMLGIECDGFMYHSSKAARDRDRLRQQVLVGLGWRLHRIWGTAWYRNRAHEEARLKEALELAKTSPVAGLLTQPVETQTVPQVKLEEVDYSDLPEWARAYKIASVPWFRGDASVRGASFEMVDAIKAVVQEEQPLHYDILLQRLRDAWNIGRIGARIKENVDAAISMAKLKRDGDFLTTSHPDVLTVRYPVDACRRRIDQIADSELELAIIRTVEDARGIDTEQLTVLVSRLFGWSRRGQEIQPKLESLIGNLLNGGLLDGTPERLTVS